MVKRLRRISEEKVFVTRELSKGATTLRIAKVFQRDHLKIKSMLQLASQQRHKKRVQPQL